MCRTNRFQTALSAFNEGRYGEVITGLSSPMPREAAEWRLLGMAQLWSGHHAEAETPLLRAHVQGDPEGSVEYGNFLRLTGRFGEALAHFEAIMPDLDGELRLRAQRWWGTSEFQAGQVEAGLRRCELAWHGYVGLGDEERTARVTQTLAQMHLQIGNPARAKTLYQEAIHLLPETRTPIARLSALRGLAAVQLETGDLGAARATLAEARRNLAHTDALTPRLLILSAEAQLEQLSGNALAYSQRLLELRGLTQDSQDHQLHLWTAGRLAEYYGNGGRHSLALDTWNSAQMPGQPPAPAMLAVRGVLMRQRGQYEAAVRDLSEAVEVLREVEPSAAVRAQLHLADAQRKLGQTEVAAQTLTAALMALAGSRQRLLYRPDLEQLGDLVADALLDPDLAPHMEAALDYYAAISHTRPLPEENVLWLQLRTLGASRALLDGEEVGLTLSASLPTLAHLALHPNRTRAELQLALCPDKDGETAKSYFRGVFRDVRQHLPGVLAVDDSGNVPRYRLASGVRLDFDVHHLQEALARGDVTRALALYRGPFLAQAGFESEWINQLRDQLRYTLGFELRVRMDRARTERDLRRVLLLANQYLKIDPGEPEVLRERIEVAREIEAPPAELARYVAELQHLLN